MKQYVLHLLQGIALLTLMVGGAIPADAQRHRGRGYTGLSPAAVERNLVGDTIENSAARFSLRLDSLARALEHAAAVPSMELRPKLSNPYYFPLFAASSLLQRPLKISIGTVGISPVREFSLGEGLHPASLTEMARVITQQYAATPQYVVHDLAPYSIEEYTASRTTSSSESSEPQKPREDWHREASEAANAPAHIETVKRESKDSDILDLSDFHIHVRRPNFWKVKGQFSTQFMQYYVSENWYKGGENHLSMLGIFNIEANYDNKQRITFANRLETKLGFQTAPNDERHTFKTNADLLRLTDKLGIRARNRWYYTVMLQSWTQFYKAYKPNTEEVSSDFMSPFEAVLSIGMDYKLEKKRVNLTATMSPVAANLKYCDRAALVGNYGIKPEHKAKIDLGSTVTVNMALKFCEQVNWVTRLYAFYDYKGNLKAEWENTVNLKVNKYLSTKLFLYPRYDNSNRNTPEHASFLQFNEYLSVGLDLNF